MFGYLLSVPTSLCKWSAGTVACIMQDMNGFTKDTKDKKASLYDWCMMKFWTILSDWCFSTWIYNAGVRHMSSELVEIHEQYIMINHSSCNAHLWTPDAGKSMLEMKRQIIINSNFHYIKQNGQECYITDLMQDLQLQNRMERLALQMRLQSASPSVKVRVMDCECMICFSIVHLFPSNQVSQQWLLPCIDTKLICGFI